MWIKFEIIACRKMDEKEQFESINIAFGRRCCGKMPPNSVERICKLWWSSFCTHLRFLYRTRYLMKYLQSAIKNEWFALLSSDRTHVPQSGNSYRFFYATSLLLVKLLWWYEAITAVQFSTRSRISLRCRLIWQSNDTFIAMMVIFFLPFSIKNLWVDRLWKRHVLCLRVKVCDWCRYHAVVR